MIMHDPNCGELSWQKSSDDYTHQSIARQHVGPMSIYCDGVGCHVLCLRLGILHCGSTMVKIPLLQAGTVFIWPQLFKSDVLPQLTNTWSGWPVAIKDDWGMLGKALGKYGPQPTTREKLLTKLQIQWAQTSQQTIHKLFRSMRKR